MLRLQPQRIGLQGPNGQQWGINMLSMDNIITIVIFISSAAVTIIASHQEFKDFKQNHKQEFQNLKEGFGKDITTLRGEMNTGIDNLQQVFEIRNEKIKEDLKRLETKQDKHNDVIERTYILERRVDLLEKTR